MQGKSSDGELLQVKFFENGSGIHFRTGTKDIGSGIPSFGGSNDYIYRWSEWIRTVLSNEIESIPTKNSTKIITSGAVYEVIGDIESSLENIITKYNLGGETE